MGSWQKIPVFWKGGASLKRAVVSSYFIQMFESMQSTPAWFSLV
jgi:hypothetical protein